MFKTVVIRTGNQFVQMIGKEDGEDFIAYTQSVFNAKKFNYREDGTYHLDQSMDKIIYLLDKFNHPYELHIFEYQVYPI